MGQPAAQLRAAHGIVKVEVRVAQTKLVVLEIGEFAQASALTLSRDSRTLTRGKSDRPTSDSKYVSLFGFCRTSVNR